MWGDAAPENESDDAVLAQIDLITSIFALFVGVVCMAIICLRCFHQITVNTCGFQGADTPDYFALLRYCHSVADSVTDCLLCYTLYYCKKYDLFYASLAFTWTPMFCSIFLAVFFIFHWRTYGKVNYSISRRIINYLDKYATMVAVLSIFGDFYCAMILVQSRIFFAPLLNFQMKKQEFEKLVVWRLVNVTLLEVKI